MNCQQIQDLMPLYVGSDLEESRARLVAAHVKTCEACSDLAREYRETRQLLTTFVPPAFTESFYADMRQSVWQNIENRSTGPAFVSAIAELFRPRLAWAVATAVLIAAAVVGIYVISRRDPLPPRFVSNQPPATDTTPNKAASAASPRDKSPSPVLASSGSNSPRAIIPSTQPRQSRKSIPDRVSDVSQPAVAAVSTAAISAPLLGDSRPENRGVSDDSRVPLRLEIQTKNPHIRIIWFAPTSTKQLSNSKGT